MALEVTAIQEALRSSGLDGWLLYDFHGSNPIASQLAGLAGGGHMTTRRWYYLIPATGEPRGLVHAIERQNLDHLPGQKAIYSGREQLEAGLDGLLAGLGRVAVEESAGGDGVLADVRHPVSVASRCRYCRGRPGPGCGNPFVG